MFVSFFVWIRNENLLQKQDALLQKAKKSPTMFPPYNYWCVKLVQQALIVWSGSFCSNGDRALKDNALRKLTDHQTKRPAS